MAVDAENNMAKHSLSWRLRRSVLLLSVSIAISAAICHYLQPFHWISGLENSAEFWSYSSTISAEYLEKEIQEVDAQLLAKRQNLHKTLAERSPEWVRLEKFELPPISTVMCQGDPDDGGRLCKIHNLAYDTINEKFFIFDDPSKAAALDQPASPMLTWTVAPPESYDGKSVAYVDDLTVFAMGSHTYGMQDFFSNELLSLWMWLRILAPSSSNPSESFSIDNHLIIINASEGPHDSWYERLYTNKPRLYLKQLKDHLVSKDLPPVICFKDVIVGSERFTGAHIDTRRIITFIMESLSLNPWEEANGSSDPISILTSSQAGTIVNLMELVKQVKNDYKHPVHILDTDDLSFEEIVATVRTSVALITPHGDHNAYALFLPPGAKVIEIFPASLSSELLPNLNSICLLPGMDLHYRGWTNPDAAACYIPGNNGEKEHLKVWTSIDEFIQAVGNDEPLFTSHRQQHQTVDPKAISRLIAN